MGYVSWALVTVRYCLTAGPSGSATPRRKNAAGGAGQSARQVETGKRQRGGSSWDDEE